MDMGKSIVQTYNRLQNDLNSTQVGYNIKLGKPSQLDKEQTPNVEPITANTSPQIDAKREVEHANVDPHVLKNAATSIHRGFIWGNTREGHNFWETVFKRLCELSYAKYTVDSGELRAMAEFSNTPYSIYNVVINKRVDGALYKGSK